ncbi:MAG TPA: hypothetical protein PKE27_20940 [Povalibacter sp.]|uniref:Kelch repeat-containing protein n=1 Tax=Povalibacter sp. TaxID=1962978 RepID=UPI002C50C465|nr:hypothetical protein [Povalibacter sp.]HMN47057.1 hypothetical protein [Povalibacter sp.]
MQARSWNWLWTLVLLPLLGACGGGGGGGSTPAPPPAQNQTIAFATAGTVSGAAGTTVANLASGGAGTGAISYSSNNTAVATIDASSGTATLLAVGTATITASKAASSGYNAASATYTLNVTQGTQAIAFAQSGPLDVLLGSTTTNAATGGAGSGAIAYVSSNVSVIRVDAGAATAVGIGSATITATKAADANYGLAQATYTLNVQAADRISAWIGQDSTEVNLPARANGLQFARTRLADCDITDTSATCTGMELTAAGVAPITDTRATLTTPAYYALADNGMLGRPVVVNHERFSARIGHGAAYFKGKYWVIGGAEPIEPLDSPAKHRPLADVWSSTDGRSWKREADFAAFGARWWHKTLVYDDKLWVIGGAAPQQPFDGVGEVYSSSDGVTWMLATNMAPPLLGTAPSPVYVNATVHDGKMWLVDRGAVYSSDNGNNWTSQAALPASANRRAHASLTSYGGYLWYIGGSNDHSDTVPLAGTTVNEVWRYDGTAWTQVTQGAASLPARFQHTAFVLGGRLWVMGGRTRANGVDGAVTADAYSTTDGLTWRPEALDTEIDRSYLAAVVEQSDRITLIGGVLRGYSSKVWQSQDGAQWTHLLPATFSLRGFADGVSFGGYLWLIGGGRQDGLDTNDVWRSADGLNWSQVATNGSVFSPRDSHRVVVFNDRLWVIGGFDYFEDEGGTRTHNNEVWSSADGVTWTQHAAPGFAARSAHKAVAFNGRLWVIGGVNASNSFNDVWSTADGTTWVQETAAAAFSPRYGHQVVAFNGALWLLGGATGGDSATAIGSDEIWTSTDGRAWTPVAAGAHFSARNEHAATVFGGRLYVVGGASRSGYFGVTYFNDVWSSADGVQWQRDLTAAPFAPRKTHLLIPHAGKLHVIGGVATDRHHDIWRSANGVAWQAGFSHELSRP